MKLHSIKPISFYFLAIVFITLSTSCNKEHDLISDYMISNTTKTSLEQNTTTTLLSKAENAEPAEDNPNLTKTLGR